MKTTNKQILIDTPPPTISGTLHMGHAFSYIQLDFISRYHKMIGDDLLYPFGYDNNGIPTERFASNKKIRDIDSIIEMSNKKAIEYKQYFNDIGIEYSDTEYNTYDKTSQEMCILSFNDLMSKGLMYKGRETTYYSNFQKKNITLSEFQDNEWEDGDIISREEDGYFIKTMEYKKEFLEMIDHIEWKPKRYKQNLINWIESMDRDWSIARNRKFGIPIPGEEDLKFDTWFISSLTPQIAYATKTGDMTLDCPTFDIRFQAHDIISTWAFYTIIKSYHHNKRIPWKQIIISGHAQTKDKEKFSKSKKNFTNPYMYINTYGSEGIRYWSTLNKMGDDTIIDENIMKNGKRNLIKIMNAKKFIEYQKSNEWLGYNKKLEDEWNIIKDEIIISFENHNMSKGFHILNDYFWSKFCDTYIELSKKDSCSLTLEKIYNDMIPLFKIFFPNLN